jgi:hypothetical protein
VFFTCLKSVFSFEIFVTNLKKKKFVLVLCFQNSYIYIKNLKIK